MGRENLRYTDLPSLFEGSLFLPALHEAGRGYPGRKVVLLPTLVTSMVLISSLSTRNYMQIVL